MTSEEAREAIEAMKTKEAREAVSARIRELRDRAGDRAETALEVRVTRLELLVNAPRTNDGEGTTSEHLVNRAVRVAERFAMIDGGHHKQWVIDQMLRHLLGEAYDAWVEGRNDPDYADWDEGVAP